MGCAFLLCNPNVIKPIYLEPINCLALASGQLHSSPAIKLHNYLQACLTDHNTIAVVQTLHKPRHPALTLQPSCFKPVSNNLQVFELFNFHVQSIEGLNHSINHNPAQTKSNSQKQHAYLNEEAGWSFCKSINGQFFISLVKMKGCKHQLLFTLKWKSERYRMPLILKGSDER